MARLGKSRRGSARGTSRTAPPWLAIGAIGGWLLVIVVGAGPSVDDSLLGVDNMGDVVTGLYIVVFCVSLVLFIIYNPFTNKFTARQERKRGPGVFIAVAIALLLLWKPEILDYFRQRLGDFNSESQGSAADSGTAEVGPPPAEVIDREPVAQATDILILLAVLVAIVLVWWLVRRRMAPEPEFAASLDDRVPTESELVGAVEQASDALDAEDDPRLGVLKAYAILEATLADAGTIRTVAETPREHLARSLRGLTIDTTPLLELADLYEMARFSERPMTDAHRRDATRLLGLAQRELLASGAH